MRIGKTQATGSQCIDVGCLDQAPLATVATDVTDSQVVGQDEDDIGLRMLGRDSKRSLKDELQDKGTRQEKLQYLDGTHALTVTPKDQPKDR